MCTDVSFSAPRLLHGGVFALLILCNMYYRLIWSVRSHTNILQCFLSSLLMNWTYLSVDPSRHSWLVPYFSQTFHSICFLFLIQFLILDLNLLKDNDRKGSGPIGLVLASSLASLCAVSFCRIPLCPGTQITATWFTSDRTVSFSIQSATSSDFVPLAARPATAAWLSVQIVICSFTSLFRRQLVTQSSVTATSAWKAVAFWPVICAVVFCFDVCKFRTCPFLSQFSQSLSHSFLVSITVRYLPNLRLRLTLSMLSLSILSAFTQIQLCPVPRFSDLVSVGGMLPSVLQTPSPFPVLADPRIFPTLLLELFSCDHNTCSLLQAFQRGPCQGNVHAITTIRQSHMWS